MNKTFPPGKTSHRPLPPSFLVNLDLKELRKAYMRENQYTARANLILNMKEHLQYKFLMEDMTPRLPLKLL